MTQLIEALSYPFVQRAIAAGVMISLCAALLGVILVLKQYSLIGHGLGDVGFASTSLAVALGLPVMAVSIPIVVIAACLIMFWSQRSKTGGDTAIGMVATGALSIGVIITAMSSGFNVRCQRLYVRQYSGYEQRGCDLQRCAVDCHSCAVCRIL